MVIANVSGLLAAGGAWVSAFLVASEARAELRLAQTSS
jgi:hypothetical protein